MMVVVEVLAALVVAVAAAALSWFGVAMEPPVDRAAVQLIRSTPMPVASLAAEQRDDTPVSC